MSTTGPVIWMTRPVAVGVGGRHGLVAASSSCLLVARQRACAPVAISIISRVMLAWRTLL